MGLQRSRTLTLPVEDRQRNFKQLEQGLTNEMASNEAKRCLRCDRCLGDGLCKFVCAELGISALQLSETKEGDRMVYFDFTNTHEKCVGCGSCAIACPHGNIEMKDDNGTRKISFCGTLTTELILETCEICGTAFAPKKHLNFIAERTDPRMGFEMERNLCPACSRKTRASQFDAFLR